MLQMPDGSIGLPIQARTMRKVAKGRREHMTGHFVFGPDEGTAMDFESHTELQVGLVMLSRADVVELENQVPFGWKDDTGTTNLHHFDYRATMRDGRRTAIFVKAEFRLQSDRLCKELATIASQVTPDFADHVVIMTEEDLDPIEAFNANLLHEVRRPDPIADAAARRVTWDLFGAANIAELVEEIGLDGQGFRALVRLVRSRDLELTHPLDSNIKCNG